MHTKRKELHRFLRDVVAQGADTAITTTLARCSEPEPRTVIATPEELARLQIAACAWEKCYLAIVAGHAMRRSEALRLSPADYDATNNTVTIRLKGERTNRIHITDELRAWFEMFRAPGNDPTTPLVELVAGKPISYRNIFLAWDKLRKKARVNPHIRIHDLRRTVAVRVYDTTKDLRAVQHLLGHKSAATTLKYLASFHQGDISTLLNQLRNELPDPNWPDKGELIQ
jgi:integrase/recombinase XerD